MKIIIPVILFSVQIASAGTYRFDMGTAQSELRDGFTRVTAKTMYTKERGYGWTSSEGLKERVKHYERREWKHNESRGRKQPPPLYTNEITCDTITGKQAHSFRVDVPPGDYTVYLLCGLSAGSTRDYHAFDIAVGNSLATIKIPGPYRFEKRMLKTNIKSGPLTIDLKPKTDWLLTSLIIFPSSEEKQVRTDFLDALEREIYLLPPDVAKEWKETKHIDDRPMPTFKPRDRSRGYALFARHWSEVIYPNTVPRPSELDPELNTFASLDEYEPVTFTLLPLANLNGIKITTGDLRSDNAVIPHKNVDIRFVRYLRVRPNYSSFFSYHIAPDVLEHRDSIDLKNGLNQRIWVTINVPKDAKPGVYRGAMSIASKGRVSAEVPLNVRVLPIRLRKNPEHRYGMYYRDPLSNVRESNSPEANAYFQHKAEAERRDMATHGMNMHISSISDLRRDDQGHWTMNGAETDRRISLDRKHGLADSPLVVSFSVSYWYGRLVDKKGLGSHLRLVRSDVPESFFDEVTRMVEAVELEKKKYNWPEFLYYPIDEPSRSEASVQFMVNVLKAIKKVPGVRTYVTADPSHEQFAPMWPYVDIWCCQPFVFGHEKIQRLSREKNIEFWCYPNHISGENDHTPVRGARMTWGYGFWKSGFKTLIPWIYQYSIGDPWNYLDSTAMDFFNRSTPDGDPIPVALWEAYREGIDDGRYVYTLEQLVQEGKRRGGRAAELAEEGTKELRFIWDAINVQEKYKYDDLWNSADFDAYRWLLASRILSLQDALK